MNKLLCIVILGLAATQILADTKATDKWRVVPSVVIAADEADSLRSNKVIGGAIANLDENNKTANTTITLVTPSETTRKITFVTRPLISTANTAISRVANATDNTSKTASGNFNDVPSNVHVGQDGTVLFVTQDAGDINFYGWAPFDDFIGTGKRNNTAATQITLGNSWNCTKFTPSASYISDNVTHAEVYATGIKVLVLLDSFAKNVPTPSGDVSSNTTTAVAAPAVNQTTTVVIAPYTSVDYTVHDVACGSTHDYNTEYTSESTCFYVVVSTITFGDNQTTWGTTDIGGNLTNTTAPTSGLTPKGNYPTVSIHSVIFNLTNETAQGSKNLTSEFNVTTVPANLIVSVKNGKPILIYTVSNATHNFAVKALSEGSDKPAQLSDTNGHSNVAVDSVESFFTGIAVFFRYTDTVANQSEVATTVTYTTYTDALKANNTATLLTNSTFFRTFKSNNTETFAVYGSLKANTTSETAEVFVGKIFDNTFASSVQTVFGFAVIVLAAIFAF